MHITDTPIVGLHLLDGETFPDARGIFARAWVAADLGARGLDVRIEQACLANNRQRGTIRGLHFQTGAADGAKTVRVTSGVIFDVAVDLRPESPTFLRWFGVELTGRTNRSLYIPAGCAHGYQTLTDDAEVFYLIAAAYAPDQQGGLRWDDPAVGIAWPLGAPTQISDRDRSFPDFARSARKG